MRFDFSLKCQPGLSQHAAAFALASASTLGWAQATEQPATEQETWNAKFQSTYVWQEKRPMAADYSGANSLSTRKEYSYSFTATMALGWRPWSGGELYLDPEAAQGVPLSNLTGLGGFTNGEMARTSGPTLKVYRARLFLRQTWGDGGDREAVESAANQLGGMVDKRRWVLTAGNLSVLDIFDANSYNHDPRTQFMNWSLMANGAFDYAADARGYSWGIALERYMDDWVLRAGRFIEPKEPNQQQLDSRIFKHYGDQIELEHAHEIDGQPGRLRMLAFRNKALMSRYQDALALAAESGEAPDINQVRGGEQIKYGVGINLEQALTADAGLFMRGSWADGGTETYAFTEIDRSLAVGGLLKGTRWGRAQDTVGLAWASNGLSQAHRQYLAEGGMGFFLGDGALNYKPETVIEAFYGFNLCKASWLTLDWQQIRNPGYNADRGAATVSSLRLHTEF
ncbi:MAG: carbohydrate porin [Aquabacterium sp.]